MMMPVHEGNMQELIGVKTSLGRVAGGKTAALNAVSSVRESLLVRRGESHGERPMMPPSSIADRTPEAG